MKQENFHINYIKISTILLILFRIKKSMLDKLYQKSLKLLLGTGINKFTAVKKLHEFVASKAQSEIIEFDNIRMLSESGNTILTQVSNQCEIEFCKKHIKKGQIVVDIGANIGYYTLIFAQLVGNSGKVFAFEPDPKNFEYLQKNIKLNEFNNIFLEKKAVSNNLTKTKLFKDPQNLGGHSLIDPGKGNESIEVETTTLDNYFKDFNQKIDFIKIDVEGAEDKVIQGGMNFFKNNYYLKMITEFGSDHTKTESSFYPSILLELGFKLEGRTDNTKGKSRLIPINKDQLSNYNELVTNLIWT